MVLAQNASGIGIFEIMGSMKQVLGLTSFLKQGRIERPCLL
jgi:hypothetical protein